jgi:hypothetical protein
VTGYTITDVPTGVTHDVGPSATNDVFVGLANGFHSFTIAAHFASGASVAATPTNTVKVHGQPPHRPPRHRPRLGFRRLF